MEIRYFKWYSQSLSQEMEYKVYGSYGKLIIYFPTAFNRFYEVEEKGVVHTLSPFIEQNKIILVSIDNIDYQGLANYSYWDKRKRLERQEQFYNYFLHELLPSLHNDLSFIDLPFLLGMSYGAYVAMSFFLRTPYNFSGVYSFSGIYNIRFFFSDYFDDLAILNSPIDYAYNLSNQETINTINDRKVLVVVSSGAWEDECLRDTQELEYIFKTKGINKEFYYWSSDFPHDFPSWNYYLIYYIGGII